MEVLIKASQKFAALDEAKLFRAILSNDDLVTKILDLNRLGQLYDKGITAEGKPLKDMGNPFTESGYSHLTIAIKEAKGQKTSNITLNDTGEFYASFYLIIDDEEFYISAEPDKGDTNLFEEWGEDIMGLTEESRAEMLTIIRPLVADIVRQMVAA